MKKLVLSIFSIVALNQAYSQCIPDGNTNGALAFPRPANAAGGSPMDTISGSTTSMFPDVVQFKLPSDTTISGLSATIDSIWIESLANFPAGIQYNCNTPDCKWAGGTNGCVTFLNTTPGAGIIEVQINLKVKGIAFGTALTIPQSLYYKFDAASVGIDDIIQLNKFSVIQNSPNPFSESTTIHFASPVATKIAFEVRNMMGQTVYSETINASQGLNSVVFANSNLANGTYFYSLNNGQITTTGKMSIQK
ncbi:MAG: T9SS type A sorting domain-containing protein [Bacteroidia bacterium]|nr:T9SS type A sorting domain-containing protein [Bacteroidia bacterium]